eukprot:12918293-Prorocentrum_lima.AAC.1
MWGWLVQEADVLSNTATQQKRCAQGNVRNRSGTDNNCMMRVLFTSRWPGHVGGGNTPPPQPCS